jgi:hypothetical protein
VSVCCTWNGDVVAGIPRPVTAAVAGPARETIISIQILMR